MSEARWKRVERKLAADVGVARIPVTGIDRDGADIEDAMFAYQVKSRRSLPSWLWAWLRGIVGTAKAKGKTGVLVLHQPGQDRAEALVVLRWADWRDLHGTVEADGFTPAERRAKERGR